MQNQLHNLYLQEMEELKRQVMHFQNYNAWLKEDKEFYLEGKKQVQERNKQILEMNQIKE